VNVKGERTAVTTAGGGSKKNPVAFLILGEDGKCRSREGRFKQTGTRGKGVSSKKLLGTEAVKVFQMNGSGDSFEDSEPCRLLGRKIRAGRGLFGEKTKS